MKKFMTISLLTLALVVAAAIVAQDQTFAGGDTESMSRSNRLPADTTNYRSAMMRGILDGRTYVGQVGEEGRTTGSRETISFANGMIHSTAADSLGFSGAIPYTATRDGDVIKLKASTDDLKNYDYSRVRGSTTTSGSVTADGHTTTSTTTSTTAGTTTTTTTDNPNDNRGATTGGTGTYSGTASGSLGSMGATGSANWEVFRYDPNKKLVWEGTIRGDVLEASIDVDNPEMVTPNASANDQDSEMTFWARAMLQKPGATTTPPSNMNNINNNNRMPGDTTKTTPGNRGGSGTDGNSGSSGR